MIKTFINRLEKLDIELVLTANYPWIYLNEVNGNKVTGKFMSNYGFTAFILKLDGSYKLSDRREVFKTIRKYRVKGKQ